MQATKPVGEPAVRKRSGSGSKGKKLPAKTAAPSKAIQIASPRHTQKVRGDKPMAFSCPAPSRPPPPPPPSARPRVPTMDPPPITLPPSPPVFSEVPTQAKSESRKQVSRSLSTYSSSCPPESFLLSVLEKEHKEDDPSILGKSPTIFSLMKSDTLGTTAPYSVSASMRGSMNSSSSVSSGGSTGGSRKDDDSDDLQFSISLNDDSLLESDSDGGFLLF